MAALVRGAAGGGAHGKASLTDGASGRMQGAGPDLLFSQSTENRAKEQSGEVIKQGPSRGQGQTHFSGEPAELVAAAGRK